MEQQAPSKPTNWQERLDSASAFVQDLFPISRWIRTYNLSYFLGRDLVAGLTVGVMSVPQALSYATVAGLLPQYGLYTSFGGLIPYVLLGTSPHLITGTTSVMSIMTRESVPDSWLLSNGTTIHDLQETSPETYAQLTFLIAFLAGILQLSMGIFRLGFIVNLLSSAVVVGFTSASAFLTASTQFGALLGIPSCSTVKNGVRTRCQFVGTVFHMFRSMPDAHWVVVVGSLICVSVLLIFKYVLKPRLPKRWRPFGSSGPLLLVAVAIPLMASAVGTELVDAGVVQVGDIPPGLPKGQNIFRGIDLQTLGSLFPHSLLIAFVGYMESMTIATTMARKYGGYSIDPSAELTAIGVCNIFCSQFQGYPVTGSFSRSSVNADTGAKSHLSGLAAALVIGLVCALFTSVLQYLPKLVLGSIIIVAVINLVEVDHAMYFYRTSARDFAVFCSVFLVSLLLGVEAGLMLGILLNWAMSLTFTHWQRVPTLLLGFVPIDHAQPRDHPDPKDVPMPQSKQSLVLPGRVPGHTLVDLSAPEFGHLLVAPGETEEDLQAERRGDRSPLGAATTASLGRVVVLLFDSSLSFANCGRLRSAVDEAIALHKPKAIVIDCSAVTQIDSSGIATLIALKSDARRRGARLVLGGLLRQHVRVLRRGVPALPHIIKKKKKAAAKAAAEAAKEAAADLEDGGEVAGGGGGGDLEGGPTPPRRWWQWRARRPRESAYVAPLEAAAPDEHAANEHALGTLSGGPTAAAAGAAAAGTGPGGAAAAAVGAPAAPAGLAAMAPGRLDGSIGAPPTKLPKRTQWRPQFPLETLLHPVTWPDVELLTSKTIGDPRLEVVGGRRGIVVAHTSAAAVHAGIIAAAAQVVTELLDQEEIDDEMDPKPQQQADDVWKLQRARWAKLGLGAKGVGVPTSPMLTRRRRQAAIRRRFMARQALQSTELQLALGGTPASGPKAADPEAQTPPRRQDLEAGRDRKEASAGEEADDLVPPLPGAAAAAAAASASVADDGGADPGAVTPLPLRVKSFGLGMMMGGVRDMGHATAKDHQAPSMLGVGAALDEHVAGNGAAIKLWPAPRHFLKLG